tara:strand:+ start:37 stop:1797 length:1761 start_codon:yes stop_codon:yes gene_type:complete
MGITDYGKQLRPREQKTVDHVGRVRSLLEAEEIQLAIDELLPTSATDRTQIYEAAVVLVAMAGANLSSSKIKSVMKSNEFSSVAKSWTTSILEEDRNGEVLSEWYANIGYPISKLGKFKDFIHENINQYYRSTPSSFEYPGSQKDNTADVVLIVDGTKTDLFSMLEEIKSLPEKEQIMSATTENDGKVIITNSKGKQISFYQVSAKKAYGGADRGRIGKVGAFINKNIIKGTPHLPSKLLDLLDEDYYSHLSESEYDIFLEGFFNDTINKFKGVISKGFSSFKSWVMSTIGKLKGLITKVAQNVVNRVISKDKGFQAANNIIKEVGLNNLVEAPGDKVTLTNKLRKELDALQPLVKKINIIHKKNISLVEKLNKRPKMKIRPRPPIYMPNPAGGLIDESTVLKEIKKISDIRGDKVSRDKFKLVVSIAANAAANIAINAILKTVERQVENYEDLTESLFAFSSTLEAEARFGNTALPVVITYGGKDGKNVVLGKRDDYTKRNAKELVEKGKELNDFYIAVIEIYKSGGNNPYNIAKFHLVTGFEENQGIPFPQFTQISIANSSGSKFYTKIEADAPSPKASVALWT